MKFVKHLLAFLPALILLYSCQDTELDVTLPQENPTGIQKELREVIITAQAEDPAPITRSETEAEQSGGTRTFPMYWLPGDKMMVYSAGEASEFTSINTTRERVAKFKGVISVVSGADDGTEKDYVWAIYPSSAAVGYSEPNGNSATAVITADFPSTQSSKAGSYADDIAMTIGRSESLGVFFKSVYSCLYFTFARNDIASITLKGRNNETLAGRINVTLVDNVPVATPVSGYESKEVTIYAPQGGAFVPGQEYYMVFLPQTFAQGISLTLRRTDGQEGTFELRTQNLKLSRNVFTKLPTPDSRVENQDNIDSGISTGWHTSTSQGLNEILYLTNDSSRATYTVDGETGNELDAVSGFKRVNGTIYRVIRFKGPITEIDAYAFERQSNITYVILPSSVTTIKENAFKDCINMTSIDMGGNVKVIKDRAFFDCGGLTELNIPEGVESIGDQAFALCGEVVSVSIPQSVTEIGSAVFESCYNLESFTGAYAYDSRHLIDDGRLIAFATGNIGDNYTEAVPDVVKFIDRMAYSASNMTGITLPEGLEEIGTSAFAQCFHLKNLTIPASVTKIHDLAFDECEGLEWVKIQRTESIIEAVPDEDGDWFAFSCTEDCPIYVPSDALYWYTYGQHWNEYGYKLGENNRYRLFPRDNELLYTTTDGAAVSLPARIASTVEVIAPNDNDGLGIIRASSDWTTIPSGMFNSLDNPGTANLKSIIIPDKVTTIEREAFFYCENLEDVTFGTGVRTIDNIAFFNCGFSTLVIPETIRLLRGSPFGANSSLTTVELPRQVELFGGNPFMNCKGLIKFTGDHPYISEDGKCLITPEGKLISYASASTTDEFVVPESVTEFGDYAMSYASCAGVKILSLEPPTLGSSVFESTNGYYVSVPDATYSDYQVADGWSALASAGRLKYHQSVRSIWYTTTDGVKLDDPTALPTGCTLVRNVYLAGKGMMVFSDTVLDIPEAMINNNQRLKTLSLPDKLEVIGKNAFSNCLNLESVSLGNRLQELGEGALYMNNISTLTLPQSLKKIGKQALGGTKLVTISIPASVTTFGDMPFYQSYQLESFTGDSPYISSDQHCLIVGGTLIAFTPAGVNGSYQVPSGVTSIGQYSMMRSEFTSLTLPASLRSIGMSALRYCESLKTVVIPESVTSIGALGLSDCTALESIKMLGNTPPTLGNFALRNMPDECKIYIPWAGISAYAEANNWSALTDHFQGY